MSDRTRRLVLAAILVASALVRLHHLVGPDGRLAPGEAGLHRQQGEEHRPRPMNPLRNTLDFLDDRGGRTTLIEEVPLYTGLLGLGYRLAGEHDWVGHVLSLAGTLAALGRSSPWSVASGTTGRRSRPRSSSRPPPCCLLRPRGPARPLDARRDAHVGGLLSPLPRRRRPKMARRGGNGGRWARPPSSISA